MSTLKRSEEIARMAHEGQTDKQGRPYIHHPLAVMSKMPTEELKIIAMLHDVVEDHPEQFHFDMLTKEGFSESVTNALKALTRSHCEDYEDYIRRVAENDLAVLVKLADLEHNMDRSRIPNITQNDSKRFEKYQKAYDYLTEKASENKKSGTLCFPADRNYDSSDLHKPQDHTLILDLASESKAVLEDIFLSGFHNVQQNTIHKLSELVQAYQTCGMEEGQNLHEELLLKLSNFRNSFQPSVPDTMHAYCRVEFYVEHLKNYLS